MKTLFSLFIAIILTFGWIGLASAGDPLFISLTSDESHRASMAISFGSNQLQRDHPLTLFLNDKAVAIGSTKNTTPYAAQQKMIADILQKGGTVFICPMCMKHYGVTEADLLPGLKVSSPDLTEAALFAGNTKTLSW